MGGKKFLTVDCGFIIFEGFKEEVGQPPLEDGVPAHWFSCTLQKLEIDDPCALFQIYILGFCEIS